MLETMQVVIGKEGLEKNIKFKVIVKVGDQGDGCRLIPHDRTHDIGAPALYGTLMYTSKDWGY